MSQVSRVVDRKPVIHEFVVVSEFGDAVPPGVPHVGVRRDVEGPPVLRRQQVGLGDALVPVPLVGGPDAALLHRGDWNSGILLHQGHN
jgi:hypothetical protein